MMDPTFDTLAVENPEIAFAKVDIDQHPVSVYIIHDDDEEYLLTAKCCRIFLLHLILQPCLLSLLQGW